MQKFKMPSYFSEEEEPTSTPLPKFSEIDLAFVKEFIYVDYDEDDLLITLLIESAKEVVVSETKATIKQLNNKRLASVLVMMIVSDLYNSRTTVATDVKIKSNPLFVTMMKSIRGKLEGYTL